MSLTKHWFNTGVSRFTTDYLQNGDMFIDNIRHIPFSCHSIPDGFKLVFLSSNPNMKKQCHQKLIRRQVYGGNMLSKFAYFKII